uniref:DUF4211 domain-containing protein n=1 Tax=Arcella intermedia TaxID=1963864 RepID=A0A6B2L451_9EUKA
MVPQNKERLKKLNQRLSTFKNRESDQSLKKTSSKPVIQIDDDEDILPPPKPPKKKEPFKPKTEDELYIDSILTKYSSKKKKPVQSKLKFKPLTIIGGKASDELLKSKKKEELKKKKKAKSSWSFDDEIEDEMADFVVPNNAVISQYDPSQTDDILDDDALETRKKTKEKQDNDMKRELNLVTTKTYSLKEAFQIFIQYLISANMDIDSFDNINEQNSEYAKFMIPPLRKIEDEIFAKKESLASSSAWKTDFKHDLERFPVFRSYVETSGTGFELVCEACNRKNHAASYVVMLEGIPYDSRAFWSGKLKDNPRPDKVPKEITYRMGKHCHFRTALFHKLQHYKYHTYIKVQNMIEEFKDNESAEQVLDTILDSKAVHNMYENFKRLGTEVNHFGIEEDNEF